LESFFLTYSFDTIFYIFSYQRKLCNELIITSMKSLISTLAFGLLFLNPANAKYNRYVGNDCERSSEGMTSCGM
jgi:hypothetical protein